MSCGKPHEVDCDEVLERVHQFLDGELDGTALTAQQIRQHLEECDPCLRQFDLDRVVKALVARSCTEHAPEELRAKVLVRIRQVRVRLRES